MEPKEFGEYLKAVRLKRKISIRKLQQISGVSNGFISQVERGLVAIPKPDTLRKLADGLKIPFEELLEQTGIKREDDVIYQELIQRVKQSVKDSQFVDIGNLDKITFIADGQPLDPAYNRLVAELLTRLMKDFGKPSHPSEPS